MMRSALVTILPMFAAAVLMMVGGERLARRDVEQRTPADRGRLFDLAESFRKELERLDALYLGHLDDLTRLVDCKKADQTATAAAAAEITGVRLIRVFRKTGNDLTI